MNTNCSKSCTVKTPHQFADSILLFNSDCFFGRENPHFQLVEIDGLHHIHLNDHKTINKASTTRASILLSHEAHHTEFYYSAMEDTTWIFITQSWRTVPHLVLVHLFPPPPGFASPAKRIFFVCPYLSVHHYFPTFYLVCLA
jgi:hypothetical protein